MICRHARYSALLGLLAPVVTLAPGYAAGAEAAPLTASAEVANGSQARPGGGALRANAAPAPRSEPLVVWVSPGSGLDAAAVRAAIAAELRTELTAQVPSTPHAQLDVDVPAPGKLQMTYRDPAGTRLERRVDLPDEREQQLAVIALLAGNLARNEAAELLAELTPKPAVPAQPAAEAPPPEVSTPVTLGRLPVHFSLFHPIEVPRSALNSRVALELGLVYAHIGALRGGAFTLGLLRTDADVTGVTVTPVATHVGGRQRGVGISGLYSGGSGSLRGVALAGLVGLRSAPHEGIQVSGLVGRTAGFRGLQVSGLVNWSAKPEQEALEANGKQTRGAVEGAQFAALSNVTTERLRGLQWSGAFNYAGEVSGGLQLALVNTGGPLKGLQVGLVNVAGDLHGAQFGLVNVARDVKGAQLGLANVARAGRVHVDLWSENAYLLNVGARFVSGYVTSLVGVSQDPRTRAWAPEAALGAQLTLGRFDLGAEALYRFPVNGPERDVARLRVVTRLVLGVRVLNRLRLFATGGASHQLQQLNREEPSYEVRPYFGGGLRLF